MNAARFEIVRTDAGHHARFRASNGQVVWTTEVYGRRRAALRAIEVFVEPFLGSWVDRRWATNTATGKKTAAVVRRVDSWNKRDGVVLEIRDVDERGHA